MSDKTFSKLDPHCVQDLADALSAWHCPYFQGTGECDRGCEVEPACVTGSTDDAVVEACAALVGSIHEYKSPTGYYLQVDETTTAHVLSELSSDPQTQEAIQAVLSAAAAHLRASEASTQGEPSE